MSRVLVVGERPADEPLALEGIDPDQLIDLDAVDDLHLDGANDQDLPYYDAVVRCHTLGELATKLAEVHVKHGEIHVLDLLDHGAPGGMIIGADIACHSNGAELLFGDDLLATITPLLADTAQLRLLGCETALGKRGRHLLLSLARRLGQNRIVFGTISRVVEGHFTRTEGYSQRDEYLFSSLAALDGNAPTAGERHAMIIEG